MAARADRAAAADLVDDLLGAELRSLLDSVGDRSQLLVLRRSEVLDSDLNERWWSTPTTAARFVAKLERLADALRRLYRTELTEGRVQPRLVVACAGVDALVWLARAAAGRDVTGFPANLDNIAGFVRSLTRSASGTVTDVA